MKNTYFNLLILLSCYSFFAQAQTYSPEPFACEPGLFQVVNGQLNTLNPSNGNYSPIGDHPGFHYNNIAYNGADGFIYGISRGNGFDANGIAIDKKDLIKIDKNGRVFWVMDTGEAGGAYAGDIVNGELWVRRSSTRYEAINLTTFEITQHILWSPAPPADWTLIGNILYGVHGDGQGGAILYRIDTYTNQVIANPIAGMTGISAQAFGAAYTLNNYQLYVSNNNGGIWILDDYYSSNPTASYQANTAVTNSNDGSSCPSAPFPSANLGSTMTSTFPVDNGDGTYCVYFTITIENFGNLSVYDLTCTDNLSFSFGQYVSGTPTAPGTYTIFADPQIIDNSADPFTVNASFTGNPNGNGNNDHNLILTSNGGELDGYPVVEDITITFGIKFYPEEGETTFYNQAVCSGDLSEDGETDGDLTDYTTRGSDADPTSDNNPVNDSEVNIININEICDNGIDDDGDGKVDCDDEDCSGIPSCGVSSGFQGGLESETNKDLAAKIAARDFERTTNNINLTDQERFPQIARDDNYGSFSSGVGFREEFNINEFMPIDIFPEAATIVTSPEDLVEITNATQVASVDMLADDQRIAAVLGVKSDGVYQHSKYICDRVKGATIKDIFQTKIDGEHDFTVTYFTNRDGNTEFNTNISLYVNEAGDFTMESHWNLDDYPQDKTFYNFQIWANGLQKLEALTNEIIQLLEAKLPITDYQFSGTPAVYAKQLFYDNGKVVLDLVNLSGATNIRVKGASQKQETSDKEDFEYGFALNGTREERIEIPTDGLYSFGADIVSNNSDIADVIFTADGFWGLAYQAENTTVDEWEITESDHEAMENATWIERNFEVKATTNQYLSVYRSFNPAFEAEDFSDYEYLSFEIEGSGALEVTIVKSAIERIEDQMNYTYFLDGSCKTIYIHRSEFENTQAWDDVKMIYFTQRHDGRAATSDIDLKISNVAFVNADNVKDCDAYNTLALSVFPNPSQDGKINFKIGRPEVSYTLSVTDQLGREVFTQDGSLLVDGMLTLNQTFVPGVYFYHFELPSGPVSGKFMVQE